MVKIDSKESLLRMMKLYQNLVFSICLKMLGDYFVAEDITQDTFLTVYEKFHNFNGDNERAWICRIATNKCIDYLRSAKVNKEHTLEEEHLNQVDHQQMPLEIYETQEVVEALKAECQSLPKAYQEISLSFFVEGMSAKEISIQKNLPIKTVQTKIYRARDLLRKRIRKEDLLR